MWAARVTNGRVEPPVRVSAPGQAVGWGGWSPDGKQLVYYSTGATQFFVDMSGTTPGSPRPVVGISGGPAVWSPNGRYAAFSDNVTSVVTIVDASQAIPAARTTHLCPADGGPCLVPGGSGGPVDLQWSSDGQWLFAHNNYSAIWSIRVDNGVPAEPKLVFEGVGYILVEGMYVAPIGAQVAVYVHYASSMRRGDIRIATPDYAGPPLTADAQETHFGGWLPNGDFHYFGLPPGGTTPDPYARGDHHIGFVRIFDVSGTQVSFKFTPDGNAIALVVNDANPSAQALYLRQRNPAQGSDPSWLASELAVADFTTSYAWAFDSRSLLYAKSSLFVLDAAGSRPVTPRELPGSIPSSETATSLTWGRRSHRIFYTTSGSPGLRYIDYRGGAAQSSSVLTPTFAHSAGDAVVWELSSEDSYVAANADFASDSVFELYVTSVSGTRPSLPQRVDAVARPSRFATTFAWQPVPVVAP